MSNDKKVPMIRDLIRMECSTLELGKCYYLGTAQSRSSHPWPLSVLRRLTRKQQLLKHACWRRHPSAPTQPSNSSWIISGHLTCIIAVLKVSETVCVQVRSSISTIGFIFSEIVHTVPITSMYMGLSSLRGELEHICGCIRHT